MVDIMYFDYWLRGTRHFKFIEEAARLQNFQTLLLHTSSWREGKVEEPETIHDGFHCRDISYYNFSLIEALKTEQPKVVVLLNQQTEDRIITRYCRLHGIKTVFLMHGVLVADAKLASATIDSAFGLRDRLKRVKKYRRLFIEYLKAFNKGFNLGFLNYALYKYFVCLFISPGKIVFNVWKFKDSYADLALVYTLFDFDLFTKKMGFKPESVKVVGNYNLDDLFIKQSQVRNQPDYHLQVLNDLGVKQKSRYVVYMEGGFYTPGYVIPGWSLDSIAAQIRDVASLVKEQGLFMVVKLHPSSDYGDLAARLTDIDNILLTRNFDLNSLVLGATAVMGQSSSALMVPVVLRIPLLILSIEPLNLIFKDYLDNEFGVLINSYDELKKELTKVLAGKFENSENYEKNISYHLHPFDGKSRERIANTIFELIPA